jgi:type I restriction enzyme S subunit
MKSDWPIVTLGDYCSKIGSGATPRGGSSVYLDEGEICLIRSQNIYNDGFKPDGLVFITEDSADKLKNVIIEEDDILLNITGDSVARVCLAKAEYLPARVNQHVATIRPKPNEFDARFLRYFLVSPKMQNLLLVIASAGATRNALTKGMIESLEVPKPPLEVQTSIADNLSSLDQKITLNRQINQTLESITQAIFKSWFVDFEPVKAKIAAIEAGEDAEDVICAAMRAISGKTDSELDKLQAEQPEYYAQLKTTAELFPSAMQDSELGEVPEGWTPSSIGAEFNATMGQSPPGNTYNENGEGEPFFQGRRDFGWRYPENRVYCTQPKRMAKKGDTLLSVRAPVGDVNKAITDCCIGRGVAALRHKLGCEAYTYYSMMDLSRSFKSFDSEGTVFGSINQKDLKALKVVKPSNIIVEAFTHTIEVIDHQILNLDDQVRVLAKIRDTLLPKLLSGELSVDAAKLAEEN